MQGKCLWVDLYEAKYFPLHYTFSDYRLAICDRLSQGIKENASVIYEDLGSLRAVCELEEFSSHPDKLEFSEYDLLPQADFEFNEPTRLQRCIAFEALAKKHAGKEIILPVLYIFVNVLLCFYLALAFLEPSIESSFSYIRECCQERKFQLAHRRLAYLKGLANTSATKSLGAQKLNTMTNKVLLEEAKVFWASNEQKIAKCQLVELLAKLEAEQRDRSDGQTLLYVLHRQF